MTRAETRIAAAKKKHAAAQAALTRAYERNYAALKAAN